MITTVSQYVMAAACVLSFATLVLIFKGANLTSAVLAVVALSLFYRAYRKSRDGY